MYFFLLLCCENFTSSIKCCDACWKCCLSTCQATTFAEIPATIFFFTFSSCRNFFYFCHPYPAVGAVHYLCLTNNKTSRSPIPKLACYDGINKTVIIIAVHEYTLIQ